MSDPKEGLPAQAQDGWVDPELAVLHQDTYRKVMFGEVSDPLFPPHPAPAEATEDDLTRAAMEDPAACEVEAPHANPTFWRVVVVLVVAIAALTLVFWKIR